MRGVEKKLDDLGAHWGKAASAQMCSNLLPDHPWVGEHCLSGTGLVSEGAPWVTCADLVFKPDDPPGTGRPSRLTLRCVAALARHEGIPIDPAEIADYEVGPRGRRLEIVPAGTHLSVIRPRGWIDHWYGAGGSGIEFALPDKRWFIVTTEEADESGGWAVYLRYDDLTHAAVIVPADHLFATDPDLVDGALYRIERAALASAAAAHPKEPDRLTRW